MIGMEDITDIKGFGGFRCRHFAIEEVEEVGCLAEIRADWRKIFSQTGAMEVGGDDTDLCSDGSGAMAVFFTIDVTGRHLVVESQHGDTGADDIHRVGILRSTQDEVDDTLRKLALGAELMLKSFQLFPVRQSAVPEEIDNFLVADLSGQFVDVVTGVDQRSFLPEHITECGGVGDDTFESFSDDGHGIGSGGVFGGKILKGISGS